MTTLVSCGTEAFVFVRKQKRHLGTEAGFHKAIGYPANLLLGERARELPSHLVQRAGTVRAVAGNTRLISHSCGELADDESNSE
jgi:hypothetical protein